MGIDFGWTDPLIVALFVLAAASLIGFVLIERRISAMALVPNDVLQNQAFVAACMAVSIDVGAFLCRATLLATVHDQSA